MTSRPVRSYAAIVPQQPPAADARKRLILLGASNLTRGIATVVETARSLLGSPLEVYAALGHGRSYGVRSSIAFGARALPGILECGLWKALETSKRRNVETSKESIASTDVLTFGRFDVSTFALITDIGNDIMYGSSPLQIANWVEQCVERLQHHQAKMAMTMLPIESIRATKRWQYAIVKAIMFPTRELTFVDAIDRANELHDLIVDLAQRRNVAMIEPHKHWYGFDPIHIRWQHWPAAWAHILGMCTLNPDARTCARPSPARWANIRMMMPQRYWLFGVERSRSQPAGRFADGSAFSFY